MNSYTTTSTGYDGDITSTTKINENDTSYTVTHEVSLYEQHEKFYNELRHNLEIDSIKSGWFSPKKISSKHKVDNRQHKIFNNIRNRLPQKHRKNEKVF